MQIECVRQRLFVEKLADILVGAYAILKARFLLPRCHGVRLNPFVSILARRAVLDQILQKLPGKDESLRGVKIPQHAFGKDLHVGDDLRRAVQHVIEQNRGIGQNDAFDGAVRNIALVP